MEDKGIFSHNVFIWGGDEGSPNWKKNCHINSNWILESGLFLIPTL